VRRGIEPWRELTGCHGSVKRRISRISERVEFGGKPLEISGGYVTGAVAPVERFAVIGCRAPEQSGG
jgi:hypothetical protein